jgi:cbb3-type cytochrome oxidase subunit 3
MYKNVMSGIPGIEFYPIVALLLFFGFFVAVVAWFFYVGRSPAGKKKLETISRQPLEEDVYPVPENITISSLV